MQLGSAWLDSLLGKQVRQLPGLPFLPTIRNQRDPHATDLEVAGLGRYQLEPTDTLTSAVSGIHKPDLRVVKGD